MIKFQLPTLLLCYCTARVYVPEVPVELAKAKLPCDCRRQAQQQFRAQRSYVRVSASTKDSSALSSVRYNSNRAVRRVVLTAHRAHRQQALGFELYLQLCLVRDRWVH